MWPIIAFSVAFGAACVTAPVPFSTACVTARSFLSHPCLTASVPPLVSNRMAVILLQRSGRTAVILLRVTALHLKLLVLTFKQLPSTGWDRHFVKFINISHFERSCENCMTSRGSATSDLDLGF